MADKKEVSDALNQRVRALVEGYAAVKRENESLQKELEWRKTEMAQQEKKLVALQNEVDRLRCLYGMLSNNEEEKAFARQKLAKMVREIDRCLQMLHG